ncbi:hypothetical protein D4764_16G0010600 [Takifugu flavidus]|uniref:Ig-like domain-containing protein n=1 Tax=Takifugu flavidus TaxID=433684 RepID=A0A5C6NZ53_9TELE|nr:hypothetical protein D4764_16G0010600 [Takifugu flavidus]
MIFMLLVVCSLYLSAAQAAADDKSVRQTPPSITKREGDALVSGINCSHQVSSFQVILWYKQDESRALKLLGYLYTNNQNVEEDVKEKISFDGDGRSGSSLSIAAVGLKDSSSLSDQVHQSPADIYHQPRGTAKINCSHSIETYDRIFWYKKSNLELQLLGYMFLNEPNVEKGSGSPQCCTSLKLSAEIYQHVHKKPSEESSEGGAKLQKFQLFITTKTQLSVGAFMQLQSTSHFRTPLSVGEAFRDQKNLNSQEMFPVQEDKRISLILLFLTGVCLGVDVRQSVSDLLTKPGDKVQIFCSHDKTDYRVMLWYQRSPADTAMKLVGYLNVGDVTMEEEYKQNFNLSGDLSGTKAKNGSLMIHITGREEGAVYYCGASEAH